MEEVNKKKKISTRLIFQLGIPFTFFILVVLVGLVFSTVVTFQQNLANTKIFPKQESERLQNQLLYVLQYAHDISSLAARNIDSHFTRTHFLDDIVNSNSMILELTVYNAQGKEVLRVTKTTIGAVTPVGNTANGSIFFEQAKQGNEYVGTPFLGTKNLPFVFWAFPIRDNTEKIIGVTRTTIDLSTLWNVLTQNNIGSSYIVDNKGILLVSPNLQEMQEQKSLNSLLSVRAFLKSDTGVFQYKGRNNKDVVAAWKPLPPTNWGLITEVPTAELFRSTNNFLIVFIVLIIITLLLILYEIIQFNKKIFTPLSTLREFAIKIGEAKFDVHIAIHANNEFDLLAQTLDIMATKLKDSYRDLESKVEERTKKINEQLKDLERINKLMVDRELRMIELKKELNLLKQNNPDQTQSTPPEK